MKLKRLIIDNIASIEHAEIDFDAAPLDGEHLFLITGETGTGKSTIIDCLCLALYGETPRLNAAKGTEYTTNQHDTLQTDNVRQLLRRGAGNAEIQLEFDDNNEVPYIATWEVHRAHNRPDGTLQPVSRSLSTAEGVTPPVYKRNSKEINAEISRIIGLDMNQFFRTVVLAQGKFSEFLNSDENEKATLLEKMTGTQIYTQIGKKIFLTFRDKENVRNNLLEQVKNYTLLEEDEKKKIAEDIATYTGEQDTALKLGDGAKRMVQWLDDKAQNEQELVKKRTDLAEKEAETQTADFLEKRQLAADWELTIEPRRELKEAEHAKQQIQVLKSQKPALQEEFDLLCAALRSTVDTLTAQRNQLTDIEGQLHREKSNSEMYYGIMSIKTLLKQRDDEQINVKKFTIALQQEQERQPKVQESVKSTFDAMQRQEDEVKRLETQYNAMDVNGINAKKDALSNAKQALIQLKNANDAFAQAEKRITELKAGLEEERHTHDKALSALNDKKTIKEQAQAAVDRETDIKNLIEQAHKSLHVDDQCPICGNTIKQLCDPKGELIIEDLRTRLKQADEDLKKTETDIAASSKTIKQMEQQIAKVHEELAVSETARKQHWEDSAQKLAICKISVEAMPDNARADEFIDMLGKRAEVLNDAIRQANELNNIIKAGRDKLTTLSQYHNNAKIDLNKVNESIKYQEKAIKMSTEHVQSFTRELDNLFTMRDWQDRFAREDGFIQELENKAAEYRNKETKAQQLRESISKTAALIPAMQDNKLNIVGLTDNGKAIDHVPDNLDEQWRQFENKCINWNNQLGNEEDKEKRAQQALKAFLEGDHGIDVARLAALNTHGQAEIDAIKSSQKELSDSIIHMRGEISSLVKHQQDLAGMKPNFHEENREKLAEVYQTSQQRYKELGALVATLNARLSTDEENKKALGKKQEALDKAEAEFQQWAELNEMLGDANGNKFRKIAQSYILGELLNSANYYLSKFNNRYELEANPGRLVILVRDLQQGDITSVNTLSGGESFMVSLALALALSSSMGKIFSVDTLFIDEGFGSLSPTYLDNVMETLNRLYDIGGKRVGIISHVDLLKERVTTQVQVYRDPNDNTVSRVKVVS